MNEKVFIIKDNRLMVNGKFAYYMYSQCGLHKEVLLDMINEWWENLCSNDKYAVVIWARESINK